MHVLFTLLLMNICQVKPFLFLLVFTSADIIFQKYFAFHLALSEKQNFFVTNFPFLANSLNPSPFIPVMDKIC